MVRLKAFAAINSASLGPHGRGAETAEALEVRILGAFESALNHARLGKLDQAETLLRGILREPAVQRGDVEQLSRLRVLALKQLAALLAGRDGGGPAALDCLCQACDLGPPDAVLLSRLTTLAGREGRWPLARWAAEAGLELDPAHPTLAAKAAAIASHVGDGAWAEELGRSVGGRRWDAAAPTAFRAALPAAYQAERPLPEPSVRSVALPRDWTPVLLEVAAFLGAGSALCEEGPDRLILLERERTEGRTAGEQSPRGMGAPGAVPGEPGQEGDAEVDAGGGDATQPAGEGGTEAAPAKLTRSRARGLGDDPTQSQPGGDEGAEDEGRARLGALWCLFPGPTRVDALRDDGEAATARDGALEEDERGAGPGAPPAPMPTSTQGLEGLLWPAQGLSTPSPGAPPPPAPPHWDRLSLGVEVLARLGAAHQALATLPPEGRDAVLALARHVVGAQGLGADALEPPVALVLAEYFLDRAEAEAGADGAAAAGAAARLLEPCDALLARAATAMPGAWPAGEGERAIEGAPSPPCLAARLAWTRARLLEARGDRAAARSAFEAAGAELRAGPAQVVPLPHCRLTPELSPAAVEARLHAASIRDLLDAAAEGRLGVEGEAGVVAALAPVLLEAPSFDTGRGPPRPPRWREAMARLLVAAEAVGDSERVLQCHLHLLAAVLGPHGRRGGPKRGGAARGGAARDRRLDAPAETPPVPLLGDADALRTLAGGARALCALELALPASVGGLQLEAAAPDHTMATCVALCALGCLQALASGGGQGTEAVAAATDAIEESGVTATALRAAAAADLAVVVQELFRMVRREEGAASLVSMLSALGVALGEAGALAAGEGAWPRLCLRHLLFIWESLGGSWEAGAEVDAADAVLLEQVVQGIRACLHWLCALDFPELDQDEGVWGSGAFKAFDDPGEDWAVLGEAEIRAVWGLVFPMLEGLSRQALTRHAGFLRAVHRQIGAPPEELLAAAQHWWRELEGRGLQADAGAYLLDPSTLPPLPSSAATGADPVRQGLYFLLTRISPEAEVPAGRALDPAVDAELEGMLQLAKHTLLYSPDETHFGWKLLADAYAAASERLLTEATITFTPDQWLSAEAHWPRADRYRWLTRVCAAIAAHVTYDLEARADLLKLVAEECMADLSAALPWSDPLASRPNGPPSDPSRLRSARAHFRRALERDPRAWTVQLGLARCTWKAQRPCEALALFAAAARSAQELCGGLVEPVFRLHAARARLLLPGEKRGGSGPDEAARLRRALLLTAFDPDAVRESEAGGAPVERALADDALAAMRWCLGRDRHHHLAAAMAARLLAARGEAAAAAAELAPLFSKAKQAFVFNMFPIAQGDEGAGRGADWRARLLQADEGRRAGGEGVWDEATAGRGMPEGGEAVDTYGAFESRDGSERGTMANEDGLEGAGRPPPRTAANGLEEGSRAFWRRAHKTLALYLSLLGQTGNLETLQAAAAALAKDASAAEQQAAGAPVRLPHARRAAELAWGQYLLTLTAALQRPVETLAGAMRCVEGPGPRDPGDCQQLASPAQLELAQSMETLPLEPFQRAYEVYLDHVAAAPLGQTWRRSCWLPAAAARASLGPRPPTPADPERTAARRAWGATPGASAALFSCCACAYVTLLGAAPGGEAGLAALQAGLRRRAGSHHPAAVARAAARLARGMQASRGTALQAEMRAVARMPGVRALPPRPRGRGRGPVGAAPEPQLLGEVAAAPAPAVGGRPPGYAVPAGAAATLGMVPVGASPTSQPGPNPSCSPPRPMRHDPQQPSPRAVPAPSADSLARARLGLASLEAAARQLTALHTQQQAALAAQQAPAQQAWAVRLADLQRAGADTGPTLLAFQALQGQVLAQRMALLQAQARDREAVIAALASARRQAAEGEAAEAGAVAQAGAAAQANAAEAAAAAARPAAAANVVVQPAPEGRGRQGAGEGALTAPEASVNAATAVGTAASSASPARPVAVPEGEEAEAAKAAALDLLRRIVALQKNEHWVLQLDAGSKVHAQACRAAAAHAMSLLRRTVQVLGALNTGVWAAPPPAQDATRQAEELVKKERRRLRAANTAGLSSALNTPQKEGTAEPAGDGDAVPASAAKRLRMAEAAPDEEAAAPAAAP
ncbi:hypothetical protein ACKKBG_A18745 [Auxenochlorella protothecoides x Auxenochlorella symbiontica]